jgi:peptidyl-tRNA hydrolase
MPLYMDIHHKVDGLTADAVQHAHEADVQTQNKYGVEYLKYWFDEGSGKVFCLVKAPSKEAAATVHREAHGLEADEIIEVQEGA